MTVDVGIWDDIDRDLEGVCLMKGKFQEYRMIADVESWMHLHQNSFEINYL